MHICYKAMSTAFHSVETLLFLYDILFSVVKCLQREFIEKNEACFQKIKNNKVNCEITFEIRNTVKSDIKTFYEMYKIYIYNWQLYLIFFTQKQTSILKRVVYYETLEFVVLNARLVHMTPMLTLHTKHGRTERERERKRSTHTYIRSHTHYTHHWNLQKHNPAKLIHRMGLGDKQFLLCPAMSLHNKSLVRIIQCIHRITHSLCWEL